MKKALIYLLLGAALMAIGFSLSGLIIMWLWNWLLVGLFSLPSLSFPQAFGIGILLGIVGSYFKTN